MFTSKLPKLTLSERYDTQYEEQDGRCSSCGEPNYFPRLFGIPTMTWTSQIVLGGPEELICDPCKRALQRAHKELTTEVRREDYIRKHARPL